MESRLQNDKILKNKVSFITKSSQWVGIGC